MKFRIKVVKYKNGEIRYYPQKRICFIWRPLGIEGIGACRDSIHFDNKEDCQSAIRRIIDKEIESVEKEEFINSH